MKKWLDSIAELFSSLKGWLFVIVAQFLSIGHIKVSLFALFFVFVLDFITGVCASYKEFKQANAAPRVYFIESSKLRLSILKAVSYMLFILLSYVFYLIILDKPFSIPGSTRQFTIVEITSGLCMAIECLSILENIKRIGFDFIGSVTIGAHKFWDLIHAIKHD